MKKFFLFFLFFFLFSLIFIGCLDDRDSGSSNPTTIDFDKINDQNDQTNQTLTVDCIDKSYCVKHFNTDITGTNLAVTFNLGSNTKDVYAIFTNPTTSSFSTTATVSSKISNTLDIDAEFEKKKKEGQELLKTAHEKGLFLIGKPELDFYRAHIDHFIKKNRRENSIRASTISKTIIGQSIGDTHSFNVNGGKTVAATLKKQITANDRTLNIWVSDDTFKSTCTQNEADCITQGAIDKMALRFLQSGDNNDIYEWITNIYGEEWGDLNNSNYIGYDKNITILFYDIKKDDGTDDDSTIGYFNSLDLVSDSANKTVMFCMDSAICQNNIGTGLSTLAHEFQHLIGFYQKIKQGVSSPIETWADEMSSMTAENFVNTKISEINSDGSKIPVSSPAGDRIPYYNQKNYLSLTTWYDYDPDVYVSYGSSYSFGAYLARNYGGAQFFQNLIKNTSLVSGRDAVMYALNQSGCSDSFGVILQKWGASVLLSDKTDTSSVLGSGYDYNNEKSSTLNSVKYTVEALNFHNYPYTSSDGSQLTSNPKIFEGSLSDNAGNNKESNAFYKVGSNLTGSFSKKFNINKGGYITFVVR